jgi:antitoxin component of MazEF toxin-antitoxin module
MEKPEESLLIAKVFKIGGSKAIVIPDSLCERLGIQTEDILHIGLKEGKYGTCFSCWDYKKQMIEYNTQLKQRKLMASSQIE